MTYLDRPPPPKGPPWAHNSLGASVHNALANWWRLPRGERTVAASGRLLQHGWIGEGYADDAQAALYLGRFRAMVERYVEKLDPAREPVGVERTVATKTELIAVSGRIDRLDDRGGELVVVDYKTGRHAPSVDEARSSLTLALYALAAARVMRRDCHRVELHHIPTGQVIGWDHTDSSLDRHLRRAEDIAGECEAADERFAKGGESREVPGHRGPGVSPGTALCPPGSAQQGDLPGSPPRDNTGRGDDVFPPTPGAWCGWCDYRAHCPEGQLAAPQRRPWDGLATSEASLGDGEA